MRSLSADVTLVSKAEGGFLGSIQLSEQLAATGTVFLPRQFSNGHNAEVHARTTGPEIWQQSPAQARSQMPLWPAWARAAP